MPLIAGIKSGAVLSGRLAGRLSPRRTIRLGYAFMTVGALMNMVVALLPPSVSWHVLPLFVFTMGTIVVIPSVALLLLDFSLA